MYRTSEPEGTRFPVKTPTPPPKMKKLKSKRQMLVALLSQPGRGVPFRDLAGMEIETLRQMAATRLADARLDREGLQAANLFPLPGWLWMRGVAIHGEPSMKAWGIAAKNSLQDTSPRETLPVAPCPCPCHESGVTSAAD